MLKEDEAGAFRLPHVGLLFGGVADLRLPRCGVRDGESVMVGLVFRLQLPSGRS